MKKLAFLMTAAVALAACSSDNELLDNVGGGVPDKGEKVTVIATLPGGDTRVALQDVVDENGKKIIKVDWNESGECFTVMNTTDVMDKDNETAYVFTQTEGDAFTGTLPTAVEGEPYYAFYPAIDLYDEDADEWRYYYYDENDDWSSVGRFSPSFVPFNLYYQDGTLNEANTLMYATSEDGTRFDFHHLTAIVKFTLTGLPEWMEEAYVYINWAEGCNTEGVLDLTQTDVAAMYPQTEEGVFMELDAVAKDGICTFYAYLPPVAAGQTINIMLMSQNKDYAYQGEASVVLTKAIEAGKFYRATREPEGDVVSRNLTAGTVEELKAWYDACSNYMSANLTLTADINMADADFVWEPFDIYDITVDGAGHTISNMVINAEMTGALFHEIFEEATVRNLHLRNVNFNGTGYYAAGIAAHNGGSIIGCSVTGSIGSEADGYPVAGIAGYNSGSIIACWSTAELTGSYCTYGIAEDNGTVEACYYSGKVTGEEQVGTEVEEDWSNAIHEMNVKLNNEEFGWHYEYDEGSEDYRMVQGEYVFDENYIPV